MDKARLDEIATKARRLSEYHNSDTYTDMGVWNEQGELLNTDIPDLLSHISAQDAELATLRQLVNSSYVLREKPWRGLDKEDQP